MLVAWPASATAAPPPADGAAAGSTTKGKTVRRGKKKVNISDDFLIEGAREKPSAYFLFKRASTEYDWARLDARFTPLVLESVQDPLF
jgi:hypothetical protein